MTDSNQNSNVARVDSGCEQQGSTGNDIGQAFDRALEGTLKLALVVAILTNLGTGGAMAQSFNLCGSEKITNALSVIVQAVFSVGMVGAVVMLFFDSIAEKLSFSQQQKKKAKEHKRELFGLMIFLIFIGPIAGQFFNGIGILTDCTEFLIPW